MAITLNQPEPPIPRAGERTRNEWRADSGSGWGYVWQGRACLAKCPEPSRAQQIVTEHNQHATLIEQRERLLATLRKLAAFDDAGGNMVLRKQGDYSGFDEPGAVQAARELLAAIEREGRGLEMRRLRTAAGLTLREVARRLGFSAAYISNLELGRREWSAGLIKRYQNVLK